MPIDDKILKQSIYYEDQKHELDIDKLYEDWLVKIDEIRSVTNTIEILSNVKQIGKDDITCIYKYATTDFKVQESRCHAFYRIIGLPVLSKNGDFYNPGFDNIPGYKKTIKHKKKQEIALQPIDGFNKLCQEREQYVFNINDIFSNVPVSINSSVLALSSGGTQKLRSFIAPMEDVGDGTKAVIPKQYDVNTVAKVGEADISLDDFKDSSQNKPSSTGLLKKRRHIIAPFIVNGLIEQSVLPQSRVVAVPFVPSEKNLKINAVGMVDRPVLEKLIRERLQVLNKDDSGTNVKKINDYVKSFELIKDEELIKSVTKDSVYAKTDAEKFTSGINMIRAMVKALIDAERVIKRAQKLYYWVPAPATNGPEEGSLVQKTFILGITRADNEEEGLFQVSVDPNEQLNTDRDREILISFFKTSISDQNVEAASNLKFPTPTGDFSATTTEGLGDNNKINNLVLERNRKKTLTEANEALRTIEIIMGEFSGFGLCDIIAIVNSLNTMSQSDLIGLLDDDAFERMKVELNQTPERSNVLKSLQELTKLVKYYYNLMDSIYKDAKQNSKVS